MTEIRQPLGGQKQFGDFAPGLAHYTDDVLFGEVWTRPDLSARDRSLTTNAALATMGATDQLEFHLAYGKENGLTETEIVEALTHLTFYAGWPKGMAAMSVAKKVFASD